MVSVITEFFNVLAEVFIMHIYLSRTLLRKEQPLRKKWIVPAAAIIVMTLAATIIRNSNVQLLIAAALIFIWALICYKGSLLRKLFSSLVFVVIMITSDAVFIALLYILNFGEPSELLTSGMGRIVGMTGSKVFAFWLTVITAKIYCDKYRELPVKYWLMMIFMPFISAVILYGVFSASFSSDRVAGIYLISVICIIFLNYFVFNFFDTYSAQVKVELLEQKVKIDDENYKYLNEVYTEIRQLKHDIQNQIKVSEELFRNGKHQQAFENIRRYSSEISNVGDVCYTGYSSLDALINLKGKKACENGINFQIKVDLREHIKADEYELCRIFGNSLDNAIEACGRIGTDNKFILMSLTQNEDQILKVRISNSSGEIETDRMETEKSDSKLHGLGLSIIRKSVKKLGGIMSYKYQNGIFTLDILISCEQ